MSDERDGAILDNVKKKADERVSLLRTEKGRVLNSKQIALLWTIAGEEEEA